MIVKYEIKENCLLITIDDCEREELRELSLDDDFLSDAMMCDFLEPITCNGLSWILPDEIGALTDAPILSEGMAEDCLPVFYYNDYMIRSPLQDLLESGECKFLKA